MKGQDEKLPYALLMDEQGHLSDEGATLFADGEEGLAPLEVLRHVDGCGACQHRVGDAALLSAAVTRALASPAVASALEPSRAPRALPAGALAAAFAVVALASTPTLLRSPSWLRALSSEWPRLLTAVVRGLLQATHAVSAHGGWPLRLAPAAAAVVLVAAGWWIARRLPRPVMAEQGA